MDAAARLAGSLPSNRIMDKLTTCLPSSLITTAGSGGVQAGLGCLPHMAIHIWFGIPPPLGTGKEAFAGRLPPSHYRNTRAGRQEIPPPAYAGGGAPLAGLLPRERLPGLHRLTWICLGWKTNKYIMDLHIYPFGGGGVTGYVTPDCDSLPRFLTALRLLSYSAAVDNTVVLLVANTLCASGAYLGMTVFWCLPVYGYSAYPMNSTGRRRCCLGDPVYLPRIKQTSLHLFDALPTSVGYRQQRWR